MIYLIRSGRSAYKLGYSSDPVGRVAKLQTGSRERLVLVAMGPGDKTREAALHARFRRWRRRGEWFRFDERILAAVIEAVEAGTPTAPPRSSARTRRVRRQKERTVESMRAKGLYPRDGGPRCSPVKRSWVDPSDG